ncbi:Galactose oxidase/kelch, beta-propeller [Pseudocohnilembus persalinus]|uniref:Galactose oxidase/kelch, beta-propeller n=1 Tax=Pseudocohnilembus persalinus TaxID=266149 RepID=A0A0V0QT98_PSEPJ|nr:Galactose oxidase/kelch, beta-propeller [Pseudocohnilembus persalinus]|eukprot:KRX05522.1 Galactose oxidase/kelch, beta-propeller [Pseudocohnilembus persalinus]
MNLLINKSSVYNETTNYISKKKKSKNDDKNILSYDTKKNKFKQSQLVELATSSSFLPQLESSSFGNVSTNNTQIGKRIKTLDNSDFNSSFMKDQLHLPVKYKSQGKKLIKMEDSQGNEKLIEIDNDNQDDEDQKNETKFKSFQAIKQHNKNKLNQLKQDIEQGSYQGQFNNMKHIIKNIELDLNGEQIIQMHQDEKFLQKLMQLKSQQDQKLQKTSKYKILSSFEAQEQARQRYDKQQKEIIDQEQQLLQKAQQQQDQNQLLLKQRKQEEIQQQQLQQQKQIQMQKQQSDKEKQIINDLNLARVHGIKDGQLEFYTYNFDQNWWRPQPREMTRMILYKNKVFMYGGIGNKVFGDMLMLDTGNFTWSSVQQKGKQPYARFGHTMNYYQDNLIIFGGVKEYMENAKTRECLLDVLLFDLKNFTWNQAQCSHIFLQQRRNHIAEIVGKNLIVHGGVNMMDRIIEDVWILDLVTFTWSECNFEGPQLFAAYHASCPVYYSIRRNIQLYKQSEYKPSKFSNQIKYEGIYSFGGKNAQGNLHHDLRVLMTDQPKMQWATLKTQGKGPCPRYGHKMHFIEKFNFLAIYGGIYENQVQQVFLNDIFVMELGSLNWINVKYLNEGVPESLCNQSSVINQSQMIIFGGTNQHGFASSKVKVIELDSHLARKIYNMPQLKDVVPGEQLQNNMNNYENQNKNLPNSAENEKNQNYKYENNETKYNSLVSYQPLPPDAIRNASKIRKTISENSKFNSGVNIKSQNFQEKHYIMLIFLLFYIFKIIKKT